MAETQSVQSGNKYEVKKKEKKEKKREKAPRLSTRKRLMRSREIAQGKRNYEGFYSFILSILAFFVIMFILLGGINQKKAVFAIKDIGETISEFVGKLINPNAFDITDEGVYINPEKLGENISESAENFEENNSNQSEDTTTEESKEGNN